MSVLHSQEKLILSAPHRLSFNKLENRWDNDLYSYDGSNNFNGAEALFQVDSEPFYCRCDCFRLGYGPLRIPVSWPLFLDVTKPGLLLPHPRSLSGIYFASGPLSLPHAGPFSCWILHLYFLSPQCSVYLSWRFQLLHTLVTPPCSTQS